MLAKAVHRKAVGDMVGKELDEENAG